MPLNKAIRAASDILYLTGTWRENLNGWAAVGADFYVRHRLSEQMMGSLHAVEGLRLAMALSEVLSGEAIGTMAAHLKLRMDEALTGTAHLGADLQILRMPIAEALSGDALGGANIYIPREGMAETLGGLIHLGADVYITQAMYETLNGYANILNISELICIIDGEIPPGGKLVIDAENFSVLLNDENKIAWHSGDWIDIDRSTVSLTLSSTDAEEYRWEVYFIAQYL